MLIFIILYKEKYISECGIIIKKYKEQINLYLKVYLQELLVQNYDIFIEKLQS